MFLRASPLKTSCFPLDPSILSVVYEWPSAIHKRQTHILNGHMQIGWATPTQFTCFPSDPSILSAVYGWPSAIHKQQTHVFKWTQNIFKYAAIIKIMFPFRPFNFVCHL